MFFWYERTTTGQWAAHLSEEFPQTVRAEGNRPTMSAVHEVSDQVTLAECEETYPPPDLGERLEGKSLPRIEIEVPDHAVVIDRILPDGHEITLHGLTAEVFDGLPHMEMGETLAIWLRRCLPRGIAIIDLSGKKVDRGA